MQRIDAVIFDFDGVILDSEPLHFEAFCPVFKEIGFSISYNEYVNNYIGIPAKEILTLLLKQKNYKFSPEKIDAYIDNKIKNYSKLISSRKITSTPGLQNYLTYLIQQNKKLAICSGSTKLEINLVLENLDKGDLQQHFSTMTTSENVKHGKPSPEGYLLTAEVLKVSPSHCLAIEDSPKGIEAAKAAGMKVIALQTTYSAKYLEGAHSIVNDFSDLVAARDVTGSS